MGKKSKKRKSEGLNLIFSDGQETFWEVETILNRRVKNNRLEYLVKWRGCKKSDSTWEPTENLCDTALDSAREYDRKCFEKLKQQQRSETSSSSSSSRVEETQPMVIDLVSGDEKPAAVAMTVPETTAGSTVAAAPFALKIEHVGQSDGSLVARSPMQLPVESPRKKTPPPPRRKPPPPRPPPKLEDGRWYWTDEEQIDFRDVERLNVNDADARQRVTDARRSGTPIVLVGHSGWANFAKPWLTMVDNMEAGERTGGYRAESDWLDLSEKRELDIDKMMKDLGDEIVPVIQRDYNEENPLQAKMQASTFLKTCWPDKSGACRSDVKHYLHQWQFPLHPSAAKKLCHKSRRLPNNILGEDLLKYWVDLRYCRSDSPLQYIFMGREDTVSKLHRDNGGLAISIAPIVGLKECVLVHRADGATCFYHLDASLDNIDLNRYPLMAQARIWKTCIKPGEILLMPQGTYHQCRNVTPCLSYSRFHLDTVNLLPFLQSLFDGDAPELDHGEIIWNASTELMRKVDAFVDGCRRCVASSPVIPQPDLPDGIIENVNTLRSLRHVCREVATRLKLRKSLKSAATENAPNTGTFHDWKNMVNDIDDSLHHFRYRAELKPPARRRARKQDDSNARIAEAGDPQGWVAMKRASDQSEVEKESATDMASALSSLPFRHPLLRSHGKKPRAEEIQVLDQVIVRLAGRESLGTVTSIEKEMKAAYLSYEGYPALYSEYQPYEKLRVSIGRESRAEISADDVKEGMRVLNRWGDTGEEYTARVDDTCCAQFFFIRLELSTSFHIDRWFPIENIVGWSNTKTNRETQGSCCAEELEKWKAL